MTLNDSETLKTIRPNAMLLNLALMLVYFVAARFGLLLAVPPGYATPIWPPSGIALAALLIFGNRCWAGIYLGSLLANFSVSYHDTTSATAALLMASLIALGPTMQALFGSFIIRRFLDLSTVFDGVYTIIRFFLLGSICACLVAPTFSITILYLYQKIAISDLFWNWFTWWFGDVIGVLALTPIIFVWLDRPREKWASRRLIITVPTVILFFLVIILYSMVLKLDKERIQNDFEDYGKRLGDELVTQIELNLRMAEAIGDFYNSSQFVEREEFKNFSKRILQVYSFEVLAWAPMRKSSDEFYYPVVYAESQNKNTQMMGIDISAIPNMKLALNKALTSKGTVICMVDGETRLFDRGFTRLAAIYPVFNKENSINGFVLGFMPFQDIIQKILADTTWSSAAIRITDVTESYQPHVLFDSHTESVLPHQKVRWQETYSVADKTWLIDFWPTPDFVRKRQSWFIWGFLSGAMLFVSLVEISLLLFSGNSARVEKIVKERTAELKKTQEQLFQSQKLESLGNLAGGIAHDYNNILASIMGFAMMLRKRVANDEKSVAQADIIISSAERAVKLTQQLLGFARKGQYERRFFSLNDTVKQMVDILSATVSKNICIKVDLAENLMMMEGDTNQIMQVLLNLGLNARDAMPNGGCIQITTKNHDIPNKGNFVGLIFSDTGEGIDSSIRDNIFDPFFTTKPQGKGTGLGLAMVYGIVNNHGGIIGVDSSPNQGTTFSLYFPAIQ